MLGRNEQNETIPHRLIRYVKNTFRLAVSPLTQTIMILGVFPGQALSKVMSLIRKTPGIKTLAAKIAEKMNIDIRTAYQIWAQDYYGDPDDEVFPLSAPLWSAASTINLRIDQNSHYVVPYLSQFGYKRTLETFSFENEKFSSLPPDKKYYRIHCPGNSGNCSRFFSELALLSQKHPELKTITYNHPGIEQSTGFTLTQDDLVNALHTQVMHLIQQGVNPENIELTGFSIGAATAVLTAKKLLDDGIKINLYCERTFGTLSKAVVNNIPIVSTVLKFLKAIPIVKGVVEFGQKITEILAIKPVLWLSNWNMKPAKAYKQISPSRKALTLVKPETKGDGFWKKVAKNIGELTGFLKIGHGDKIISPPVSLASEVDKSGLYKEMYKEQLADFNKVVKNNCSWAQAIPIEETSSLFQQSDNAITRNAFERLINPSKNAPQEEETEHLTTRSELVSLAIVGWKSRRLQGTEQRNAHNVRSEEITTREIKGKKWLGNEINQETLVKEALLASRLTVAPLITGLTRYSMFHQAIKSHNEIEAERVSERPSQSA